MKTKSLYIILALFVFSSYGCSNEKPPQTSATKANQTEVAQNQPLETGSNPSPMANTPSSPKEKLACTAILDTHCEVCHHSTRVCQKLGKKNKKGWLRSIKNMIRHGAQLTPNEIETLAQCLAQQHQEVKNYCQ